MQFSISTVLLVSLSSFSFLVRADGASFAAPKSIRCCDIDGLTTKYPKLDAFTTIAKQVCGDLQIGGPDHATFFPNIGEPSTKVWTAQCVTPIGVQGTNVDKNLGVTLRCSTKWVASGQDNIAGTCYN